MNYIKIYNKIYKFYWPHIGWYLHKVNMWFIQKKIIQRIKYGNGTKST